MVRHFQTDRDIVLSDQRLIVLGVVGACALLGSVITHELGAPVRRAVRRLGAIAVLDGVGGAVLTVAATLGTI